MPDGFVHSIKVPRLYKTAANIVRGVREEGGSFKTLIYERKHPNVSAIYALTYNTLQKGDLLDHLIRSTGILIKEPRLDPWLARVLITELIWGKQHVVSESKPVQTVLAYETQLRAEFNKIPIPKKALEDGKIVKKPRYIRINTLFVTVIDAIGMFEEEGWQLMKKPSSYHSYLKALSNLSGSSFIQDFHIPELFAFPPGTNFYQHAGYIEGQLILQDKASCLPAYLLNPKPGSVVLDMCAAPGMKTSHLAAILKNEGTIYAAEIDTKRCQTLREQLKLTNSYCASVINTDAMTLDEVQCPDVEYILVDPSCSGSGMMNRPKIDNADGDTDIHRLKSLQSFQVLLLRHALLHFKSAKRVVYSTCSIHSKENEEVVDEILSHVGDAYKLVSVKELLQNNWINYSSMEYSCKDNCLYASPKVDFCNGFFVAVFERNFDVVLPSDKRKSNQQTLRANAPLYKADNAGILRENDPTVVTESANDNHKKRKRRGKRKRQSQVSDNTLAMQEGVGENVGNEYVTAEDINCSNFPSDTKHREQQFSDTVCTKKKKRKEKEEEAAIVKQTVNSDYTANEQHETIDDKESAVDDTTVADLKYIDNEEIQLERRDHKKRKLKGKSSRVEVITINDDSSISQINQDSQLSTVESKGDARIQENSHTVLKHKEKTKKRRSSTEVVAVVDVNENLDSQELNNPKSECEIDSTGRNTGTSKDDKRKKKKRLRIAVTDVGQKNTETLDESRDFEDSNNSQTVREETSKGEKRKKKKRSRIEETDAIEETVIDSKHSMNTKFEHEVELKDSGEVLNGEKKSKKKRSKSTTV